MPSVEADLDMDSGPQQKSGGDAEELEFYKTQIQQLEDELQDFQASSKELEHELEKELEASEKVHRELRQKNEALKYEVEEWKTKYKQTKAESNTTQLQLQKEITALREQNRGSQLKLRDLEVSNDDFERQERIVKSSLEDVESKFNIAIERNAINESEILNLEQEREELRIECQRLRDELGDLKVESELNHEKYMFARSNAGNQQQIMNPRFASPMPGTPTTPTSMSPTPRPKPSPNRSAFSSPTPPSPPISEASSSSRTPKHETSLTPRPAHYKTLKKQVSSYTPKPSFTPSYTNGTTASHRRGTSTAINGSAIPIPPSKSLNQIRGLIGQMERLEKRVQSAKSKMPAPPVNSTPKRTSPRASASMNFMPSSVTVRSQRKARPSSTASSLVSSVEGQNSNGTSKVSRLSFGGSGLESTTEASSRPSSRASTSSRVSIGGSGIPIPARPSSRQSISGMDFSTGRPSSRAGLADYSSGRPSSRASMSGDYSGRPSSRASMSGAPDYTSVRPASRTSMSGASSIPVPEYSTSKPRSSISGPDDVFAVPQRREKPDISKMGIGIPRTSTPGGGIPRRKSSMQVIGGVNRRTSTGLTDDTSEGNMGPPMIRKKKLSGVGEN